MKKYFFIFLFILFLFSFFYFHHSKAVNIDLLENKGGQLQPPPGIPENTNIELQKNINIKKSNTSSDSRINEIANEGEIKNNENTNNKKPFSFFWLGIFFIIFISIVFLLIITLF
jgi:hypothetical protein